MKSDYSFKKILVPVDGSHPCLQAEEVAALIAKRFGSRVTAIHVIPYDLLHVWSTQSYPMPSSISTEIRDWFFQKRNKIVKDAETLFKEKNIEVDARLIQYENPAETILRLAENEGCDLIVMGNRGKTEVEVYSLGSLAEKISRHAECPVLIVKQRTQLSKILVGIDGSKHAEKALQYAVQLATIHETEITLIHVQDPQLSGFKPRMVSEIGKRILYDAEANFKESKFKTRLESGNPAETIIEVAEKEGYDMIVVGSRGLSSVKRFLLGSVSDDISHHAKTSVLLVR
jgi:nucleotide-binding universal stress UspA family protein